VERSYSWAGCSLQSHWCTDKGPEIGRWPSLKLRVCTWKWVFPKGNDHLPNIHFRVRWMLVSGSVVWNPPVFESRERCTCILGKCTEYFHFTNLENGLSNKVGVFIRISLTKNHHLLGFLVVWGRYNFDQNFMSFHNFHDSSSKELSYNIHIDPNFEIHIHSSTLIGGVINLINPRRPNHLNYTPKN